jgi:hypothetical protein
MTAFPAAHEAAFLLAAVTDTGITIPVGEMLSGAAEYIGTLLAGLVVWSLRFLPAQIYALAMTSRVDQLLIRAIVFGVNSVAGAARDRVLTIEVGNRVLKEALTYALLHGGGLVKRFAGSPVDLAEKIWARLNVDETVSKPDFATIAAQVAMTLPQKP